MPEANPTPSNVKISTRADDQYLISVCIHCDMPIATLLPTRIGGTWVHVDDAYRECAKGLVRPCDQGMREKAQRSLDAGIAFTYDAATLLAALDDAEARGRGEYDAE